MAQGRLGNTHLGRSPREAALSGDHQEGKQIIHVVARHAWILLS